MYTRTPLEKLRALTEAHCRVGLGSRDEYWRGTANALLLALSLMEGNDGRMPVYFRPATPHPETEE